MDTIKYINRSSGKIEEEKVFGEKLLRLLYGKSFFGKPLRFLSAKIPLVSFLYGAFQKMPFTKRKIHPFIDKYGIDSSEFLDPINNFKSFNDFFIRKLKPEARPIAKGDDIAVIPADGRYLFFQNIEKTEGFTIKGEKFSLPDLLKCASLASQYEGGTMITARLCPTDYHRFHFPILCIPGKTRQINGYLYSVNPWAIAHDFSIFTKNKRALTELESEKFGKVLFLEIGATNVGSIIQTYTPGVPQMKGAEKGYFSFGASALVILFQPGKIKLDPELVEGTKKNMEMLCLMGQSMGIA